jgi:predicted dehydrogenase
MKLRLGIVGHGREWQTRYLPALRLIRERFQVSAVYHSVAALADSVADDFGAVRCDGIRKLVARDDVDAILLLENDWYRLSPISAACEYGKAVLCGAEIEFDPDTAARMQAKVEQSGISFMQELPRRYAPATLRLKELIATKIGRPKLLFCHHRMAPRDTRNGRGNSPPQNRKRRELIEMIDWCQYIVGGSPTWVQAVASSSIATAESRQDAIEQFTLESDYQSMSLGFSASNAGGEDIIAQVSCGTYIAEKWQEAINFRTPAAIQVCCENGLAFLDLPTSLVWFDSAGRHQESLDSELPIGQQVLTQFHRAVTSLVRRTGGLDDVCAALHALESAGVSARNGIRKQISV